MTIAERMRDLEIETGDIVDRFTCSYTRKWVEEVGELEVCDVHGEWSEWSLDYGLHRPCNLATRGDKIPLTITQFLRQIAWALKYKEGQQEFADMITMIITWHDNWPVLVETPVKFDFDVDKGEYFYDTVTIKASKEIAWVTQKEFIDQFGREPTTAPLLRKMANMFRMHKEFQDEWRVE